MTKEILTFDDIDFHKKAGALVEKVKKAGMDSILPNYLGKIYPDGVDIEDLYFFLCDNHKKVLADLHAKGSAEEKAALKAEFEKLPEVVIFNQEVEDE